MEISQTQSVSLFFVFLGGGGVGSVYRHGGPTRSQHGGASRFKWNQLHFQHIQHPARVESSRVTKLSAAKHENTQRGRPRRNSSVVLAANQPKAAENTVYGPLLNNLPNCLIRHNCKFELDSISLPFSLCLSLFRPSCAQSRSQSGNQSTGSGQFQPEPETQIYNCQLGKGSAQVVNFPGIAGLQCRMSGVKLIHSQWCDQISCYLKHILKQLRPLYLHLILE